MDWDGWETSIQEGSSPSSGVHGQEPMGADEGRAAPEGAPVSDGGTDDESDRRDLPRLNWTIRYGPFEWRLADINVGLLITIGEYLDVDDWRNLDPTRGPKVLAAYLSVLIAKAMDVSMEEASMVVFKLTPDELLDTVTID